MKILLLEDEEPAEKRLTKLILEVAPDAVILDCLVSISSGINWLQSNPMPDLIISDIQLSDGNSFEIFRHIKSTCPIIFTTAYNEYAIEAFSVNSIDYLLKPVKQEALEQALHKYQQRSLTSASAQPNLEQLVRDFNLSPKPETFKSRFVVRYGEHIKVIHTTDIAYCYTEDKANFLVTREGKRYVTDYNLDRLEELLAPDRFFRINRQYIVGIDAIAEMFAYSKSRGLIKLNPPAKHETIVSTERAAAFKNWLGE